MYFESTEGLAMKGFPAQGYSKILQSYIHPSPVELNVAASCRGTHEFQSGGDSITATLYAPRAPLPKASSFGSAADLGTQSTG